MDSGKTRWAKGEGRSEKRENKPQEAQEAYTERERRTRRRRSSMVTTTEVGDSENEPNVTIERGRGECPYRKGNSRAK